MVTPDLETESFLRAHGPIGEAVRIAANDLCALFDDARVTAELQRDPESGREMTFLEAVTSTAGREARQRLREYLKFEMPEPVRSYRDHLSFSIVGS